MEPYKMDSGIISIYGKGGGSDEKKTLKFL